jgi:ATP-binding cassette subfamily B protein
MSRLDPIRKVLDDVKVVAASSGRRALMAWRDYRMTAAEASLTPAEDPKTASGLDCLAIVARQHGLHLTVEQLIHDNLLSGPAVSFADLIRCAAKAGLSAKAVRLDRHALSHLKKALPAIVRLKNGATMVLTHVDSDHKNAWVALRDPNAGDGAPLVIDRLRFEDSWTGDVLLVKRNYDVADESQPFSLGLIMALLFRERWVARDVLICAVVLGFLGLAPILFWRLLSDKVMWNHSYNTFAVLCGAMLLIMLFEAGFYYIRQLLIHFLTTKIDVKLSTYVFEKMLNLPIDYFEQTQVGMVSTKIAELFKIRTFLVGQLFGTVLDSTVLIFFLPVMFFFSPIMTLVVLAFVGMIVAWLVATLPTYRKKTAAVIAAQTAQGSFLIQNLQERSSRWRSMNDRSRNGTCWWRVPPRRAWPRGCSATWSLPRCGPSTRWR